MATNEAHTGYGAILSKGDGQSPETFTPVLGIKSISGPDMTRDSHDRTTMDNATSQHANFRRFVGGLVDAGSVSFEANWLPRDPSQNQSEGGLMAEFDKGSCASVGNWRVDIPDCPGEPAMYMGFAGFLSGQNIEIPMDDLMAFSGSIKVDGRPELVVEA
jgi:hypothetical protein